MEYVMFEVSYSEDAVTFVNAKTNKAEKLALFAAMDDLEAIRVVNGDIKNRENVSRASVSLLAHVLNNPRLDGYKGKTPINEAIPKELKAAIRELETEFLKPIFCKPLENKKATPANIEAQWQIFAQGLREGGGYANSKSRVTAYFAHAGALPVTDNGKLLTVAAIDKLLMNLKEQAPAQDKPEGLAGKLVMLSHELENRTETTKLGSSPTAIAALKSMLATYEGLYREECERMTVLKGNIALTEASLSKQAEAATDKAASSSRKSPGVKKMEKQAIEDKKERLTAQWDAGHLSDDEFRAAMGAIGFDVTIKQE